MTEDNKAQDCCAVPSVEEGALDVRLGDSTKASCPSCGHEGRKVDAVTVRSLVAKLSDGEPPDHFCRQADCEVVYFGDERPTLHKEDLKVRVGLKEREDPIPVCYCFEHTKAEIEEDFRRHGRSRIEESIRAEVKASRCSCEFKNPSGRCCLGAVAAVLKPLKAGTPTSGD